MFCTRAVVSLRSISSTVSRSRSTFCTTSNSSMSMALLPMPWSSRVISPGRTTTLLAVSVPNPTKLNTTA